MSMSSTELLDVSFAGSTITLSGGAIGGCNVQDFMDDANPVEFQDIEVTGAGANLNGVMIRYAKPNLVMMSVTVIPGSETDKVLYDGWIKYRVVNGKNLAGQWEKPITCSIVVGNTSSKIRKKNYKLSGGTMISGPGGPTSSAEGKMQGRTYTFAFAMVS